MSGLFDQVVNYSPPLLTAGQVNYDGTWDAATNTPTLINPPDALSKGDYYVVSVAGTQFGLSFAVGDWIISNGTAWEKVDLTDAVSSVFGRTGAVVGVSTDYSAVGLTNTAIGAANPSSGAFTSLSSSSTTTLNGTTVPASKTLVVTTDKLSALAATTSAELAGVISDETGSGALVFANSPTLVTPALGTPSALVGTNITGTAAAFNVNGTVGATTPSTGAFTSVTALSNSGYQAVVGQLTSGDRVGISGQASGSGTALVFFDNAQTTFRPAIFDASSHSLKISGVEKAAVTSTGLQGAIGASTPSTGAFTTVSASGLTVNDNTTLGSSNSDTVVFNARVASDLNPSTDNTYDLGVTGHEWRDLNIDGTANIDSLVADTADINGGTIDGTAIGATTPSTVAATTLSANGSAADIFSATTTASGRTALFQNNTTFALVDIRAGGTNQSSYLNLVPTGTGTGIIQISGADKVAISSTGLGVNGVFSTTGNVGLKGATISSFALNLPNDEFLIWYNAGTSGAQDAAIKGVGGNLQLFGGGVNSATASATGLAVTGALSAYNSAGYGNISSDGLSGGGFNIKKAGVSYATFYGDNANTVIDSAGSPNLILQTGGATRATITSTGLAVTGALSSDSLVKIGGTVNGNSGLQFDVSRSLSGVEWFGSVSGAGYGHRAIEDDSGAGFSRFKLQGRVNSASWTTVLQVDGTNGLAVTGALSSTGALAIGNTVNTVSPTSPNRTVTIVIGGTTYYLAAKTTND